MTPDDLEKMLRRALREYAKMLNAELANTAPAEPEPNLERWTTSLDQRLVALTNRVDAADAERRLNELEQQLESGAERMTSLLRDQAQAVATLSRLTNRVAELERRGGQEIHVHHPDPTPTESATSLSRKLRTSLGIGNEQVKTLELLQIVRDMKRELLEYPVVVKAQQAELAKLTEELKLARTESGADLVDAQQVRQLDQWRNTDVSKVLGIEPGTRSWPELIAEVKTRLERDDSAWAMVCRLRADLRELVPESSPDWSNAMLTAALKEKLSR